MPNLPEGLRRSGFDFPVVDNERVWKVLDVSAPIATAHDCPPACITLARLLTKAAITAVIVGARRRAQMDGDLAATDLDLTTEEVWQLDEVSALPPGISGLDAFGDDH